MLTDRAKEIVAQTDDKMQEALAFLEEDLKTYRVGKANPAIFNNVTVDYYGTPTPLHQVASISAPDVKTLALQPWEKNLIPKIEKAIMDANLGLTPQNNGEIIRCTVPALTEERRRDLIKKAQKNEGLSEDTEKEAEEEVQKITDKNIKRIDEIVAAKEKEILTV